MKILSTLFTKNEAFYITSYGYEDISKNAHWGKGRRDTYILHYVLDGEGFFNGHIVKSGEGFLITPKMLHEYHSSQSKPWKYFWITFKGDAAPFIYEKYINISKNNIFEYNFQRKLMNLLSQMFSVSGTLSEAKALSYFFMLLSYHEKKSSINANHYVEEAKKYMNIHFCRDITVTEVAASICINDRYLYNLFVKYENTSPKKYLSNLRLSHAKSMLANTDSPVSEIAVSCGFSDVLSFSRYFSKKTGLSPTAYRNSNR